MQPEMAVLHPGAMSRAEAPSFTTHRHSGRSTIWGSRDSSASPQVSLHAPLLGDQVLERSFVASQERNQRSRARMICYTGIVLSVGRLLSPSFKSLDYGSVMHDIASAIGVLIATVCAVFAAIIDVPRLCWERPLRYEQLEQVARVFICFIMLLMPLSGKWRIAVLSDYQGARSFLSGCELESVNVMLLTQMEGVVILAMMALIHQGLMLRYRYTAVIDAAFVCSYLVVCCHQLLFKLQKYPVAQLQNFIFNLVIFTLFLYVLRTGHYKYETSLRLAYSRSHQLERSREAHAREREETAKQKERELMAITFHELRNPLNGTVGHLRFGKQHLRELRLSEGGPPPPEGEGGGGEGGGEDSGGGARQRALSELATDVDAALACTDHAITFLENLSSIHRAESGELTPSLQPIESLASLGEAAATIVRPQTRKASCPPRPDTRCLPAAYLPCLPRPPSPPPRTRHGPPGLASAAYLPRASRSVSSCRPHRPPSSPTARCCSKSSSTFCRMRRASPPKAPSR